jgi:hypothetical protein
MIKDRLLELPESIEKIRTEILNKQQGLEDIKVKIKNWELMETIEIANEVDDKGKAVYSNDTKRQAELQYRKNESEIYNNYFKISKELEKEMAVLEIKLDKMFNEQGNLRAICRLGDE